MLGVRNKQRGLTESSAVTSARALATKSAKQRLGLTPRRPKPHPNGRIIEWRALLDTIYDEILTPYPMTPQEIREVLRDTWGSVNDRRFWRALRTLVAEERAERHVSGIGNCHGNVYTRAIPWRRNLANCIAEAAATFAVFELGMRRAA